MASRMPINRAKGAGVYSLRAPSWLCGLVLTYSVIEYRGLFEAGQDKSEGAFRLPLSKLSLLR